ncbi:hypothetical protein [Cupriavidus necator]
MSVNLKKLDYFPTVNPLVEPRQVVVKKRFVRTGKSQELVNPDTGEISHVSAIHQVEERDDAEFVKVFAAGVSAAYDLNRTAQRVFQAVLAEYERTPMTRGFADTVELFWFGDGLSGRDVGMSEKTFQRGLKELLAKGFLAPKSSSIFWVNPSLFFKGDRVMFIKEYRRRVTSDDQAKREALERKGQQRLAD